MTITSINELSEWKIFICCIITSLLTGIITTYINKRIYESQHKHTTNNSNSNHVQQTTSNHKNNKDNIITNNTNNKHIHNGQQKLPIPPAPKNIPSTTAILTKSIHTSPQPYIASPNNNNNVLSDSKNSHSEHLHLINQVVTSYPDQIARKISIHNSPNSNNNDNNNSFIENKIDMKSNNDNITKERIVIVSFKLPINVSKLDNNRWHIEFENEMSFLSNLRILETNNNKYEIVFVGWPGIYCANNNEEESLEDALYNLNKYRCYPIFLNKTQVELAYDTFCKSILWPRFHYQMCINDNGEFGLNYQIAWKSYCDLNCKYAKKSLVANNDNDNDNDNDNEIDSYIWFHDYHLLMAAQFVKKDSYICKCGL
eukprot:368936_1